MLLRLTRTHPSTPLITAAFLYHKRTAGTGQVLTTFCKNTDSLINSLITKTCTLAKAEVDPSYTTTVYHKGTEKEFQNLQSTLSQIFER